MEAKFVKTKPKTYRTYVKNFINMNSSILILYYRTKKCSEIVYNQLLKKDIKCVYGIPSDDIRLCEYMMYDNV